MATLQALFDLGPGIIPAGSYSGPAKITKSGTYTFDPGAKVTGLSVGVRQAAVEITVPNVTIVGLDASKITRPLPLSGGDNDWPVLLRFTAAAANGYVIGSKLGDADGISLVAMGADFKMEGTEIYHSIGARFVGSGFYVKNSYFHHLDRMGRDTPAPLTNDDAGAMALNFYNNPRGAVRGVIEDCVVHDCLAPHSYDYGTDGAGIELWQSSSVEIRNCIMYDNEVTLESGSKGTVVSDIVLKNNYFFGTNAKLSRGLMFRPVVDSLVEGNKFFGLDHWDIVVNQGSSTYAAGTTKNFIIRNNEHASTVNTKPLAINAGGAPTVSGEKVYTGAEATAKAALWLTEAYAKRDSILSRVGLPVPPPPPPVPVNTAPPTAVKGLYVGAGVWTAADSISYQWYMDSGAGFVAVPDAVNAMFFVDPNAGLSTYHCVVKATNKNGSTEATTNDVRL